MAKKTKPPKNGSRKRKYVRSTSIGRMVKRFRRARESVDFSIDRIKNWSSEDVVLNRVLTQARIASSNLEACITGAETLSGGGWAPPKKSLAVVYSPGDLVQIATKYRKKYRSLYSVAVMNRLTVTQILETGEVVVFSDIRDEAGSPSKFFVVKSHLQRRSEKNSEKEVQVGSQA